MGFLEDKSRARRFYRFLSIVYDRVNPVFWTEPMRAEALSMLEFDREMTVLDVGCGTGFGTAGLLQHVDEVYALDQSAHQLEQADAKFGHTDRIRFLRGDAERLPIATDSVDLCWSSGSIEYWPRPVRALREFRRVLKPGGQVLVVGPNEPESRVLRTIANAIMLFYDEREADRMFEQSGFEQIHHELLGPTYNEELAIATVARAPIS